MQMDFTQIKSNSEDLFTYKGIIQKKDYRTISGDLYDTLELDLFSQVQFLMI